MFCPDCGTQCDSKFCPSCGRNLQGYADAKPADRKIPSLDEPYYYERNGRRIDLHKVICTYGMGWRKSGAYAYLMTELGISKAEAKEILEPLYTAHAGEKISYGQGLKANLSLIAEEERNKDMAEKLKRQELEQSGAVYCPKCLSTSVEGVKRGYSAGQALLTGSLLVGAIGANRIKCVCLKCGHKWKP